MSVYFQGSFDRKKRRIKKYKKIKLMNQNMKQGK